MRYAFSRLIAIAHDGQGLECDPEDAIVSRECTLQIHLVQGARGA